MGYIPPPPVDAGMGLTDGVEEVVEDDKPLVGRVQYCCEGVRGGSSDREGTELVSMCYLTRLCA